MLRAICLLLIGSTVLMTAGQARAGVITNDFGIANPDQTIGFDELSFPIGTPITDQFAGFGVTFTPNMFYNFSPFFFPTESLASFDGPNMNNISILFDTEVSAAAVAVQSNPDTTTFTALLDGNVVEQFSAQTSFDIAPTFSRANDFFGFEGIVFDELRIENTMQAFQIDNLQFDVSTGSNDVVPEPASLAIFGFGAVGIIAGGRRKRSKKRQNC